MEEIFGKYEDEYLHFERVEAPLSKRPDLHAFILLDKLVPGDQDIVFGAVHQKIHLRVEPEALIAVATEEQLRDLIRCGMLFDKEDHTLSMFV